jgi:hypothetical protein
MLSCQLLSERHHKPELQLYVDTAIAGVVDNPNSPISLLERRNALSCQQEAMMA